MSESPKSWDEMIVALAPSIAEMTAAIDHRVRELVAASMTPEHTLIYRDKAWRIETGHVDPL